MQIASIVVGDTALSVYASTSLDRDAGFPLVHQLFFHDLPTNTSAIVPAEGEDDALKLYAAWIVADETQIGCLSDYRKRLEVALSEHSRLFLP